jgi:hypothetical protein
MRNLRIAGSIGSSRTQGHLIAIDERGAVMATTDLATWTCIGQAPPDTRSIGSLGGTVYGRRRRRPRLR